MVYVCYHLIAATSPLSNWELGFGEPVFAGNPMVSFDMLVTLGLAPLQQIAANAANHVYCWIFRLMSSGSLLSRSRTATYEALTRRSLIGRIRAMHPSHLANKILPTLTVGCKIASQTCALPFTACMQTVSRCAAR